VAVSDLRHVPEAFRVDVHPEREVVRLAPIGELDLATADMVYAQLRDLYEAGFQHIVLDLRGLTFLDSSGLALLIAEDRRARESGRTFSIIHGRPTVERVLKISGLEDRFAVASP